jgi:FkbM family methyltransferase
MSLMLNVSAQVVAAVTRRFYPRGTDRAINLLFNPRRFEWRGIIQGPDGFLFNIDTSFEAERQIFFRGDYYPWVTNVIKKIVRTGDTAIDVGANVGARTLVMARLVGPTGRIIAFEPHPEVFKRFEKNVELNKFYNVKKYQMAVGAEEGEGRMFSYNGDNRNSSLYDLPDAGKETFPARIATLDKILSAESIKELKLLKINARGGDFRILKGAASCIKRFHPHIIFEYNSETWSYASAKWSDALDFFSQNGYALHLIGRRGLIALNAPDEPDQNKKHSSDILAVPGP